MKYQKLGSSDIEVSKIAFGAWGLGGGSVWADMSPDVRSASHLLDIAEETGINYIDTAPVYGTGASEEILGKALQGRRDRFILQTKCSLNWRQGDGNFHYERDGYTVNNCTSAAAVRKDVEESLLRMNTDYIDVIVVHYVCPSWPVSETMASLNELIKEGKIRAAGLSNSQPADLDEYAKYGNIALVQEQYSLIAPLHGRAYFDTCRKHGTTFQVYGALEEGFLTGPEQLARSFKKGDIRARLPWYEEDHREKLKTFYETLSDLPAKYNCSWAVLFEAWTMTQYDDMNLLIGFRREETIRDTVKCLDIHLTPEDIDRITAAAEPASVETIDK